MNQNTSIKPLISTTLFKSLSIKERIQLADKIDTIDLNEEEFQSYRNKWKEETLLNDDSMNKRIQVEQLDEKLFIKALKASENEEWLQQNKLEPNQNPLWMNWIEEALTLHRNKELNEPDQLHISLAFRPFMLWAKNRFNKFYQEHPSLSKKVDWDQLQSSILYNLIEALTNIGARTITLELYIAKQLKELTGNTPEERFESFVRTKLLDFDALEFIYKEYPVLSRILMIRTNYYVNAITEALTRFEEDWDQINQSLKLDALSLKSIAVGLGDSHQQGRSVMRFKFEKNKEILYKPKPLTVAIYFHELLDWINKKGFTPKLKGHNILNRQGYVWEECIQHRECKTQDQIENYYKRLGGYLAILNAVNGTDFHHENIVADGEFPTLIDLETIFHHPAKLNIKTAEIEAKYKIINSVLGTALLPHLYFKNAEGYGIDISGVSVQNQEELPIPLLRPENEGTDEMRFVRKKVMADINDNNVPKLNGKVIGASSHVDSIIEGYQHAAQIIFNNKSELLHEDGPIAKFKDTEIRIVVRPTQYYGNFLLEKYHPDYMRDCVELEKLLDRLWFTVLDTRQIPFEKQDLFNGDIPIFTTKPGSRDLFASSGEKIENYFDQPSYEIVVERIKNLTLDSIEEQSKWIEASLSCNIKEKVIVKEATYLKEELKEIKTDIFIEEAKNIGYRLKEQVIHGSYNDATWVGLGMNYHNQWQVTALDSGLYNGLSGIAMFLGYLGKVSGEEDFNRLAMQTMESILQQPIQEKSFASAFYGQASHLYILSHFDALYGENQKWKLYIQNSLNNIEKSVKNDQFYDLLGGSAGIIQVLLNIHEQFNNEQALNIAQKYGNHLIENKIVTERGIGWSDPSSQIMLGGLSHGTSGIAWSLLRLHKQTSKQKYFETALEAIRYDRSLYNSKNCNWADLRCSQHKSSEFSAAWCHGATGIGLSRLLYLPYIKDTLLQQEIETAVSTTVDVGMGRSHSLCHGDLGNSELFHVAGNVLGRPEWNRMAHAVGMNTIKEKQEIGKYKTGVGRHIEIPGLFMGLSGIGYQLLRLAKPNQVPSVLTLEKPIKY
ncbi:type 2 lanthipeptide synthetase LanM family protein [Bacillus thuringiensis]|uniref:type 2 lanthipeptide synthetase LanM family protein n=1 Tax=Bacillus thuringiensis TaxID=1428 RepID=UPI0008D6B466|nr:type 2 lanthipeptide synthetase LanM family protein [Bacillus thuringiensis]MDY0952038.1 type 2 lanthipeptide synthetase LanM family protein [Bacillus thuringiensis]PFI88757.1 type 2 lantipeptide synthetase LanM [Bacillus thuringiensis]SEJ44310.1 type 2 lantibiotic biosynthesis protein LanM [Bacillus thuringiensis]